MPMGALKLMGEEGRRLVGATPRTHNKYYHTWEECFASRGKPSPHKTDNVSERPGEHGKVPSGKEGFELGVHRDETDSSGEKPNAPENKQPEPGSADQKLGAHDTAVAAKTHNMGNEPGTGLLSHK